MFEYNSDNSHRRQEGSNCNRCDEWADCDEAGACGRCEDYFCDDCLIQLGCEACDDYIVICKGCIVDDLEDVFQACSKRNRSERKEIARSKTRIFSSAISSEKSFIAETEEKIETNEEIKTSIISSEKNLIKETEEEISRLKTHIASKQSELQQLEYDLKHAKERKVDAETELKSFSEKRETEASDKPQSNGNKRLKT